MQNAVHHFFFQNLLHGFAVGKSVGENPAGQRAEVIQDVVEIGNGQRILIVKTLYSRKMPP